MSQYELNIAQDFLKRECVGFKLVHMKARAMIFEEEITIKYKRYIKDI